MNIKEFLEELKEGKKPRVRYNVIVNGEWIASYDDEDKAWDVAIGYQNDDSGYYGMYPNAYVETEYLDDNDEISAEAAYNDDLINDFETRHPWNDDFDENGVDEDLKEAIGKIQKVSIIKQGNTKDKYNVFITATNGKKSKEYLSEEDIKSFINGLKKKYGDFEIEDPNNTLNDTSDLFKETFNDLVEETKRLVEEDYCDIDEAVYKAINDLWSDDQIKAIKDYYRSFDNRYISGSASWYNCLSDDIINEIEYGKGLDEKLKEKINESLNIDEIRKNLSNYSLDELRDIFTDIINETEGLDEDDPRVVELSDLYNEVDNAINKKKISESKANKNLKESTHHINPFTEEDEPYIEMSTSDFNQALTYEGDDEPDISWLLQNYNIDIDKHDHETYIFGDSEDLQEFIDYYMLSDYGVEIILPKNEKPKKEWKPFGGRAADINSFVGKYDYDFFDGIADDLAKGKTEGWVYTPNKTYKTSWNLTICGCEKESFKCKEFYDCLVDVVIEWVKHKKAYEYEIFTSIDPENYSTFNREDFKHDLSQMNQYDDYDFKYMCTDLDDGEEMLCLYDIFISYSLNIDLNEYKKAFDLEKEGLSDTEDTKDTVRTKSGVNENLKEAKTRTNKIKKLYNKKEK